MSGTVLRFSGGYLGFERCRDPENGKEYLRAVIHNASTGRTTSAPVELKAVFEFATDAVREALLADGHAEAALAQLKWTAALSTAERPQGE